MTTLLQALPTREERLGIYDLSHFGWYLGMDVHAVSDPHKDLHKSWMPGPDFKKVPASVAVAFNHLCIRCLDMDPRLKECVTGAKTLPKSATTYEVSVTLYRNYETGEIRGFVEPQVVGPATVDSRSLDDSRPPLDIITGEEMRDWQSEWHEFGRFHSHNTMAPFPSGTDDASELKTPGVYGIFGNYKIVDNQWRFNVFASVVTPYPNQDKNIRRTTVAEENNAELTVRPFSWRDVMEFEGAPENITYHDDVLKNIMFEEPEEWKEKKKVIVPTWSGSDTWKGYSKYGGSAGTSSKIKHWDRFDDEVGEALDLVGMGKEDYGVCKWRLRTILNALDEMMESTASSTDVIDALDWALNKVFHIGVYELGEDATEDIDEVNDLQAWEDYLLAMERDDDD